MGYFKIGGHRYVELQFGDERDKAHWRILLPWVANTSDPIYVFHPKTMSMFFVLDFLEPTERLEALTIRDHQYGKRNQYAIQHFIGANVKPIHPPGRYKFFWFGIKTIFKDLKAKYGA